MQCTAVLEPIFIIRRGLLHLTESNLAQAPICELLLHSCRMSRLAGHLQIAWAYLVEAKALNVNHFEVAMEEARFLFEKVCKYVFKDIIVYLCLLIQLVFP